MKRNSRPKPLTSKTGVTKSGKRVYGNGGKVKTSSKKS